MRKRIFVILLTFIVIFSFSISTFALTIKPIEDEYIGGGIQSIRKDAKLNFYVDNQYVQTYQTSGTTLYNYLALVFADVENRDDMNRYGYLVGYSMFNSIPSTISLFNYNENHMINTKINIDNLIGQCGDDIIVQNKNVTYSSSSIGTLTTVIIDYSGYSGIISNLQGEHYYNIMMYTDSIENNSYYRKVYLQLGSETPVSWMWINENLNTINIGSYETQTKATVPQIEYLKGLYDLFTDDIISWGRYCSRGYSFMQELGTAYVYGDDEIIVNYMINNSYGDNQLDTHPQVGTGGVITPPDSSTNNTTSTTNNGGSIDDETKTTLLEIIDRLFLGMSDVMGGLLNNCIVFGVPLLNIIGVCLLIVVIIILVKVALR